MTDPHTIDPHMMVTSDVARVLDLSTARVIQLDDELEPVRLANGWRRYDPAKVQRYAKQRLARQRAGK